MVGIKFARILGVTILNRKTHDTSMQYSSALRHLSFQTSFSSKQRTPVNQKNLPSTYCTMGGLDKEVDHSSWLENGVKYVRILWCDGAGERRCRMVPASKFKSGSILTSGIGLASCVMAMSSHYDGPAPGSGLTASGEIQLIPDPSTGRVVFPQPGHAFVLGDMYEEPEVPWELCPRGTLRRLEKALSAEFGLELRAGFEIEFYLLRQLDGGLKFEPVDSSPYSSTSGFNRALPVIETILSWLESLGVEVDQFHCEGGEGQFECVLKYDNASKSADGLIYAREGIDGAAISHQLLATFLPKPPVKGTEEDGSGNHVHLSIWNAEGKNVLGAGTSSDSNHGLSDLGKNFLAGVHHHLPSLLAIVASHPNSYERLLPNTWSGAYQCWGTHNREAPLRAVLDPKTGAVNNLELKSFDGCSNPHLGLAAILAAGLDGLRKKIELPDPVNENPDDLAKEGKVTRLPTTLKETVESLKNNDALKDLLGHKLVTALLAIRQTDDKFYSKHPIKTTSTLEPHVAQLLDKF